MAQFGVVKDNDDGGASPRFHSGTVVSRVRVFRSDAFFSDQSLIGQPANFSAGMAPVSGTITPNSPHPINSISGIQTAPGAVLGWNMTLETLSANIELDIIAADQNGGSVSPTFTIRVYNGNSSAAPILYNGDASSLISAGPITTDQVYVEYVNTTGGDAWLFQWTATEVPALGTVRLLDPVPNTPAMTRAWIVTSSGDPAIPAGTSGTGNIDLMPTFGLGADFIVRVTDTVTAAGVHQNDASINATEGGPFEDTSPAITFLDPDVATDCGHESNEVHSHQISMVGNALGLPLGHFVRFVVSTSPTGPFTPGDPSVVFLGSNRPIVTGANPEQFRHTVPHQGLFLQPDTDYYWTVQHIGPDATTIISQAANICQVRTRAADDENYIECVPPAAPIARTAIFAGARVPAGNEDFPANLAGDQMLVEIGPTATGPWTTATRYNGLGGNINTNTPGANPTGGVNPGGGLQAAIGNLTHGTSYFVRHTLTNTAAPSLNPIQQVVCGPHTTFDRPNPTCGLPIQITQRRANVIVNASTAPDEGGGATGDGRFAPGDVVSVEVATVAGGPYTPAGSFTVPNAPTQFGASGAVTVPLTGLQPGTQYFYRIRCTEVVESGAQYWLSPECATSFTTLPVPVDADCDAASNVIGVSGLTLTAVSNSAPAGTSLRFRVGTAPGGPYTTFVGPLIPTTAGANQQYTQVIPPGTLQPDTAYYWRVEWIDTDTTAFLGATECQTRTLPLPNCETVRVFDVTSFNAKIEVLPPDWLAGDTVRVLVATSPGGPFNAALVHDVQVTNEPITLDFLSVLLPARTYYYQIEIDHQPATGIPDYFSPVCSFTTAGGQGDGGPWVSGDPRCMNECPAGSAPISASSSGCCNS